MAERQQAAQDIGDDSVGLLVRARLLDATYRSFYLIAIVQVLVGLFFVVFNWPIASHERLTIWYVLLLLATVPLVPKRLSYFQQSMDSPRKLSSWSVSVLIQSFALGGVWGLASVWFLGFTAPQRGIVNLMIILGMSFGAGIVIKTSPLRVYVYTIPAVLGLIYALLAADLYLGLYGALVALMFVSVILAFMHTDHREIVNNIRLSIDVDRLHRQSLRELESRNRLMTAVGHDLRQPLAALNVLLASLSSRQPDGESQDLLEQMDKSVKSIDGMLASLLSAARLEAGVKPAHAAVALVPLCRRLRDEVQAVAAARGNRIIMDCRDVMVGTDEKMLESVLRNLLDNAAKYTRNGEIILSSRLTPEYLILAVEDNGPGIEPDKQQRIFEEFTQLGKQDDSHLQGFGLGLSIASRTAALLGFTLSVQSEPGKGSCFSLKIPRRQVSEDVPAAGAEDPESSAANAPGACIGVVSGDPALREMLREWLIRWNYRVVAVGTTDEPEPDVAHACADLVILDELPRSAARRLWPHADRSGAVIVLSETAGPEDASAGRLPKPVKPAKLRALIRNLLLQAKAGASQLPDGGLTI